MGRLTTHVIDTASGKPAAGVVVDLHEWRDGARRYLNTLSTGVDGRAAGASVAVGTYELVFHAGDYFRAAGVKLPEPPFLDEVVIRFGVSDADAHYHVPLLLAPYGYSTYRGS
jgi:5-hydroxyisourate hydrolase